MSFKETSLDHEFDGLSLTIEKVEALSKRSIESDLTADAWERVEKSREIVDKAVASGKRHYGINTGVGSQKDVSVDMKAVGEFNQRMIIGESTDMPGASFSKEVVRASLAVLINNVSTGALGVRRKLVERMLRLISSPEMPTVRQDTSYGCSDLCALSQLSLPLIGKSLDGRSPSLDGDHDLAAKEAVSLINNNSFALGHGALVLCEANRLLRAFDVAAAVTFEGFRANLAPYQETAIEEYRNTGHRKSCSIITRMLKGSALWQADEARLLQDPLSFRFVSRVNGSGYLAADWARSQFETDINSGVDNPVVNLASEKIVTSVCMDSTPLTLSMDSLRQSLAKIAEVSVERALKVQSPPFTGLPAGLSEEGAPDGGIISILLNYLGVARMAHLRTLSAPVLLNYSGQISDGVEDVASLAPLSVLQTEKVIDLAWQMVTVELTISVWAIARRKIEPETLGAGVREIYRVIHPLLPIGEEGVRIFDMNKVVSAVRDTNLIEFSSSN